MMSTTNDVEAQRRGDDEMDEAQPHPFVACLSCITRPLAYCLNAVQGRGAETSDATDATSSDGVRLEMAEEEEEEEELETLAGEGRGRRRKKNKKMKGKNKNNIGNINTGGKRKNYTGKTNASTKSKEETDDDTLGKGWGSYKQLFCERLSFVNGKVRDNKVPTPVQLKGFLEAMCTRLQIVIKRDARGTDVAVVAILQPLFSKYLHWNFQTNAPLPNSAPPTAQQVAVFLQNMIAECFRREKQVRLGLSSNPKPTATELHDLSSACNKLWKLDHNRLIPGSDYKINLQNGKRPYHEGDRAPEPLFSFVKKEVFEKPTYKLFYALLDNYIRGTGVKEDVTRHEKQEEHAFLTAIMKTLPMKYTYNYAVKKGAFTGSEAKFCQTLQQLWFQLYKRETWGDSSAFEHVFVGEERDGKTVGMHNWLQLYRTEKQGTMDYKGYIKPKQNRYSRGHVPPGDDQQLITIQFSWEGDLKPVSTSFVGVSPEFEFALLSLCFLCGEEDNDIHCGPYHLNVKCYSFGNGHNRKIGTAYPEALPFDDVGAATKVQARVRGNQSRSRRR